MVCEDWNMIDEKLVQLLDKEVALKNRRMNAMEGKDTAVLSDLRERLKRVETIINSTYGEGGLHDYMIKIEAEIVSREDLILGKDFCDDYYKERESLNEEWLLSENKETIEGRR